MKSLVAATAVLVVVLLVAVPIQAQSENFGPHRLSNGPPDLNGIWQVLNAAHYDVEPHIARHAIALRDGPQGPLPAAPVFQLGAVGAVPGSMGVIDGGTPDTLLRRGLRRDSIVPGTIIIVDGYQSKDRTARANGRDVTFEDGRKFFMGSSGTGAPRDGRDPTEPR